MSADVSESLDDFFAKKDKKKKTKKSKCVFTPDDFNPINEKSKSKSKSSKTITEGDAVGNPDEAKETATDSIVKDIDAKSGEEPAVLEGGASSPIGVDNKEEEDEWNDFAAEEEADYSGLRIQKLNIQQEEVEEEDEIAYDDEGKVIETECQVWKIPEAPAISVPEPATEVQSVFGVEQKAADGDRRTSSPTPSSQQPQKYIPPAQRMAMKAAAAAASRVSDRGGVSRPSGGGGPRRQARTAPDINNEELFPTLCGGKSGGVAGKGIWGGLGSNASSRGQSPLTGTGGDGGDGGGGGGAKLITDVSLDNKWEALSRGAE